jgi:hypothetical protein
VGVKRRLYWGRRNQKQRTGKKALPIKTKKPINTLVSKLKLASGSFQGCFEVRHTSANHKSPQKATTAKKPNLSAIVFAMKTNIKLVLVAL